jgi:hypothetical protein
VEFAMLTLVVAEVPVQVFVMEATTRTLEMVFSAVSARLVLPNQQAMSYLAVLVMRANLRISRVLLNVELAMPTLQGVRMIFQVFVKKVIFRLVVMASFAQSVH